MTRHVYTDGACSGNPGPGGWAWAVVDGPSESGGDADTTNQRMELTAVLRAVESLDGPILVHSDSTYVVNCFNERWFEGWLKRNWRNSQKKPVANRDLWEPLIELFIERESELAFEWVKGHSGDPMNDLVDQMAVAEVERHRPIDESAGSTTDAVRQEIVPWPVERAIAVTGVSTPSPELVEVLNEVIDGLDPGYDIVVSGLRRGSELLGAEAARRRGIPLGAVLPFADPARNWPSADRSRFEASVDAAEWVVTLDGDPAKPGLAVAKRNEWLWASVVGAMVVGDPALVDELDAQGLGVVEVVEPDA